MLRIILLIALLASLVFAVRQFNPAAEAPGEQPPARTKAEPLPGDETTLLSSPVPLVVPEIYDGYLFVEERKLEEGDFGEFGEGQETSEDTLAALEQVFYSGSLIVGEIRQALVSFQENTRAPVQPVRSGRGGRGPARAASSQNPFLNKLLQPGDRFLGYVVAAIEPDKIVFEKGGEKVEKFLFDRNKKRLAAGEGSGPVSIPVPAQGGEGAGMTAQAVSAAVVTPPDLPPSVRIVPAGESNEAAPPTRRVRRSQRLLGTNSLPGLPTIPVPPARPPVPSNN